MSKSKLADEKVVNNHIRKTNKAFTSITKSNKSLFDVVRDAYDELKEYPKSLQLYKLSIDCDNSTFNKIVNVSRSNFVRDNIEKLPTAWSVLYIIAKNEEEHSNIFAAALESGELTKKSSGKEVMNLIYTTPKKVGSIENVIRWNSAAFSDHELERIIELMDELKSLGFIVKDAVKVSGEPEAEVVEMKEAA